MSKQVVFTMKLGPELPERFMAEAANEDRQAHEYNDYLRRKVEAARRQRDAGLYFSNEEVEAEATVRRTKLLYRIGAEDGP